MARAPDVPPEVLTGVNILLAGRVHGLAYDDIRAGARNDVAAVEAWLAPDHNLALHIVKRQTPLAGQC